MTGLTASYWSRLIFVEGPSIFIVHSISRRHPTFRHYNISYWKLLSVCRNINQPPFGRRWPAIRGRGQLNCDGTRAETRFRLSAKRTGPFKSARSSVQSTPGSRGVRISGSNAGYTMFRGSVKGTGYPLHSPVSPSLPLSCVIGFQLESTSLLIAERDWRAAHRMRPKDDAPTERCTVVFRDTWRIIAVLQGTERLQRRLHWRRENKSQLLFAEPGIFDVMHCATHTYEKWHCF